ncbi:MAG: polyprenyl synthetase family protein [Candidatus Geothermarchaeales archaeon]
MDESLRRKLNDIRNAVGEELRRIKEENRFPQDLYDAAFHLPLTGGKRVRPFLAIKSAQMFGSDVRDALPVAIAVELLHNFTLIHDDIMDRDEFRRGVPTTHVVWGEPIALAAGDALFSMIFSYVVEEMGRRRFDPPIIVSAVETLSRGAQTICEGQTMDVLAEKYISKESEYLKMVYKKTAALFKVSCVLGGIVGGASEKDRKHLDEFGRNIGVAFQIVDDVLGIVGDPKVTGKPVGNDLRLGKKTLIVIHALEKGSGRDRREISSIFGNEEAPPERLGEVIDLLIRLGSVDHARETARKYMDRAIDSLLMLPDNEHRGDIESLARFICSRER